MDAILEAGTGFDGRGINGLSKNVFDDLLAKGTAVRNKRGAHVILRLFTMHLQEWWSVKLLKESLMAYASSMSADGSNMSHVDLVFQIAGYPKTPCTCASPYQFWREDCPGLSLPQFASPSFSLPSSAICRWRRSLMKLGVRNMQHWQELDR